MTTRIYGIKNCNTMKKAFAWFEAGRHPFEFHDYKKHGIDADTLGRWCRALGWKALINKRGTTWRRLSPAQQAVDHEAQAVTLMQQNTSLIRRPVIETGDGSIQVGFDPTELEAQMTAVDEADK